MNNYQLVKNAEWKEVEINGEIKEIPINWDIKKIRDLTSVTSGGTPSTNEPTFWDKKDIKWLSSGEVCNKRIYNSNKFISKKGLENSSAKLISANSILIALAGQGKTRGQVGLTKVELSTNQSIGAILPSNLFVSEFIYYNLLNRYEELRNISGGDNGRGGLNLEMIKNIDMFLPNLNIQSAIASILSEQESVIQNIESLITKYEARFQYLSNELLSGKLRVKEVDGEVVLYKNEEENWKEVEVNGEVVEIPKDWDVDTFMPYLDFKNGSAFKPSDWKESGTPIIRIQNLTNKDAPLNFYQGNKDGLVDIKSGDYLFSWSGTLDIFKYIGEPALLNQHIFKLNSRNNGHLEYLVLMLKKQLSNMNTNGLTMSHITLGELKSFLFPLTKDIKEQVLIESILSQQKKLIEEKKALLSKEKKKFEWLLDNLLSGKYLIKE